MAGPDGNVWFTEYHGDNIGKINPNGVIDEYPIPTPDTSPQAIVVGSDGNLWFTEANAQAIGRITPGGTITEFPVPKALRWSWDISAGPDGNLWFTRLGGDFIGRMSPSGSWTAFPLPSSGTYRHITTARGYLWFTNAYPGQIGRMTTSGVVSQTAGFKALSAWDITEGPDRNLWFTLDVNDLIALHRLPALLGRQ